MNTILFYETIVKEAGKKVTNPDSCTGPDDKDKNKKA